MGCENKGNPGAAMESLVGKTQYIIPTEHQELTVELTRKPYFPKDIARDVEVYAGCQACIVTPTEVMIHHIVEKDGVTTYRTRVVLKAELAGWETFLVDETPPEAVAEEQVIVDEYERIEQRKNQLAFLLKNFGDRMQNLVGELHSALASSDD